jgi:tRNA threonylcarbamoyladenosine biosynthesis protein TsaB
MLVAAIDASTLTLSCALLELRGEEAEVLTTRTDRATGAGGGHGIRLPGALTDLLGVLGRKVSDVEGFAVGLGPGSFTGLRIGLAAMALEAGAGLPADRETLLVPLLDARKGEVYAGFYRASPGGVTAVRPEEALAPEAVAERVAGLGSAVGFGEGYAAYRDVLAAGLPFLETAPATPSGDAVGRLAAARLARASFDDLALFALEPHYVRKSEAEVKFPNGLP